MIRPLLTFACAAALAACGPGQVDPDGGPDGGGDMGGLVFQFTAPDLGTQILGVRLTRLSLRLRNLRANGDGGPSPDTYRAEREIELEQDTVAEVRFDHAPPGRYSAFEFDLERESDGEPAWDLLGQLEIGGDTYQLEIADEQTSPVSLALDDLDLPAGQTVQVSIVVDLAEVIDSIDWTSVPIDDGQAVVDEDSPTLLATLRASLLGAFVVESISPIE